MKKMISRRNFLKVCAVAGSAVALSACGGSKSLLHRTPPTPTRPALISWAVSLP